MFGGMKPRNSIPGEKEESGLGGGESVNEYLLYMFPVSWER